MAVQEDVAFNPGVCAIEIEFVIAATGEDVVDELNDGRRAVAAGEINDVVVAHGQAEKVPDENAASAALDAAGPMHRLECSRGVGKHAIADDEGRAVHVNVRRAGVAEGEVIEMHRARRHLETGCAG